MIRIFYSNMYEFFFSNMYVVKISKKGGWLFRTMVFKEDLECKKSKKYNYIYREIRGSSTNRKQLSQNFLI